MGAENSCDVQILVYQTAEPVSAQWSDGRAGVLGSVAGGRVLIESSVRAVRAVRV